MYKIKNAQKPKSCWEILIKEVAEGSHRSPMAPPPVSKGVTYATHYRRRNVKYELGEPLASIYFTQREAECVIQTLQGKTMNEAGNILSLSPRTIEYYLSKIKRKLKCHKKRDIIQMVSKTEFVKNFEKDPYNQK